MPLYRWQVSSPVGPLYLESSGERLLGLRFHPEDAQSMLDPGPFRQVVEELEAYFAGTLQRFGVAFQLRGTPFQQRVWQQLCNLEYGQTCSYAELAAAIGQPKAVRAVGLANGRNPISILVPCHRVIGKNGSLTGYGGGLERKQSLLELERGRAQLQLSFRPGD